MEILMHTNILCGNHSSGLAFFYRRGWQPARGVSLSSFVLRLYFLVAELCTGGV